MKSLEELQEREHHHQLVIQGAVDAADRIIMDGSDGSCEETNFLTAKVAEKLMEKALLPFNSDMMRRDLES